LESVSAKYPSQDPEFSIELTNKKLKNNADVLLPKLEKERLNFLKTDYKPNNDWWNSKVTKD